MKEMQIFEESTSALPDYGTIPIAFQVESRFRVETIHQGLGGLKLIEERVTSPYIKDYDQTAGEGPANWSRHFDISHWGMLSAFQEKERVVRDHVLACRLSTQSMPGGTLHPSPQEALWRRR
jgi:hypothetical protein